AIVRIVGDDHDVERRAVVDEDLAVTVVDDTARRRHADEPDAVVLRQRAHLGAVDHLQEPQPGAEQQECDEHRDCPRHHPHLELRRDLSGDHLKISRSHISRGRGAASPTPRTRTRAASPAPRLPPRGGRDAAHAARWAPARPPPCRPPRRPPGGRERRGTPSPSPAAPLRSRGSARPARRRRTPPSRRRHSPRAPCPSLSTATTWPTGKLFGKMPSRPEVMTASPTCTSSVRLTNLRPQPSSTMPSTMPRARVRCTRASTPLLWSLMRSTRAA